MYKITVCGSFHRHLLGVKDAIDEFEENGCEILSPRDVKIVADVGDFLFVASNPYRSIKLVESQHLFSIAASDFVWLVAPDEYIGQSAAIEVGYAIAKSKPIYCERTPSDLTIAEYVTVARSPSLAIEAHTRLISKQHTITHSVLLDTVKATQEAHYLIDKIALLLSQPGLVTSVALEKEVAAMTCKLIAMYNLSLTS